MTVNTLVMMVSVIAIEIMLLGIFWVLKEIRDAIKKLKGD